MSTDLAGFVREIEQLRDNAFAAAIAPAEHRSAWADCRTTGYPAEMPVWLATWLMIVADNTIHLAINLLAVSYL